MTNFFDMSDLAKIVEGVANRGSHDTNWLLVVMFCVACIAIAIAMKMFLTEHTKTMDEQRSERAAVARRLEQITDRHIESVKEVSAVVAANTVAIGKNSEALNRIERVMDKCEVRRLAQ